MTTMNIQSIADAKTFVDNSGGSEWEWGGSASLEGFTEWVYRNTSKIDSDNYDAELKKYLISAGEAPEDYSL